MVRSKNPFRELERLFEQMQENIEDTDRWWEPESLPGAAETRSIRVDLEDRDGELVLTAELPGFDKDDIDVRVTDRTLRLEAEHEETEADEEEGEFIRRERRRAAVNRSVRLPEAVEIDEITATYNNGVLTVTMPKTEPVTEGTQIEVS